MWSFSHTVRTKASASAVWNRWSRPTTWTDWDHALDWVKLEGPFEKGNRGTMQPSGAGVVEYVLSDVQPNKAFSDVTRLPLSSLEFHHTYRPLPDGGGEIEHKVVIRGLLTPLFSRVIGRKIQKEMPTAMAKLSELCEKEGA